MDSLYDDCSFSASLQSLTTYCRIYPKSSLVPLHLSVWGLIFPAKFHRSPSRKGYDIEALEWPKWLTESEVVRNPNRKMPGGEPEGLIECWIPAGYVSHAMDSLQPICKHGHVYPIESINKIN